MPTINLMGAHFRPPAKLLLSIMQTGYPLELRLEPENPYDPNAIAVWADAGDIDPELLQSKEAELSGSGDCPDFADELELKNWRRTSRHLGYIAKERTQEVRDQTEVDEETGQPIMPEATLVFSLEGKPQVSF